VLHRGVNQHGQRSRHADAAVGAQRRPFGLDPLAVDVGADGILLEVELHVGVLLADHVHVRLQHDGRPLFEARSGRLADDHVADGVLAVLESVALGEIDQKGDNLALLLRRTGNLRDGVELLPDDAGFESGDR